MNFQPPEEDDPRDDDQRQQAATKPGEADLALPKLPKPAVHAWADISEHFLRADHYTAEQMRAYALAALGTAPATPVPDPAFSYASSLATALFQKHFAHEPHYASGKVVWSLCDTTVGILTQIDNMVSGLVQPVPASEPVAWEATTTAYKRFVTDRWHQKSSDAVKRWYKPYRCSSCATSPAPAPATQADAAEVATTFPPRILALLHEVADRVGTEFRGPFEDGNGEPLQDDADAALAWIAAAEVGEDAKGGLHD